MRRKLLCSAVLLMAMSAGVAANADDSALQYPNQPVRVISPYPPGGATEIIGRIVGDRMAATLGQPLLIDSRPGASGMIGAEIVAKSKADGYTLLLGATPVFATNIGLFPDMKYHPVKDFEPIAKVATVPLVLVVGPQVPANNFEEFLNWVRSHPQPLSYASPSVGSPPHLTMEALKKRFSLDLNHVPYKGSAQAMTDVMGGHVAAAFDNLISTFKHVKSGRMKALAVGHSTRIASLPDVPTFNELGYPELQAATWLAFVAPAGTPRPVVDKLNDAARRALAEEAVTSRLLEQGAIPSPGTPQELGTFIRSEIDRWAAVIKDSGVSRD
jgi:tripartite-type tricarboxylate transporter receptor subunit TctC